MTATLLEEWRRTRDRQQRQPSRFLSLWLTEMLQRGRVSHCDDDSNDELWQAIASAARTNRNEDTLPKMREDFHLIQAALPTDQRIASLDDKARDDKARTHFSNVASLVVELAGIAWVNPGQPEEAAIAWLELGAPRGDRCLAF